MVRRLRDARELGQHVAQRGLRRVPARTVLAREARAPGRGRLLPRRVPPVYRDRPAAPDSGVTDRTGLGFETPKVFRMPVTIRVGTTSGDVVRRAELAAREQTIEIPGLVGAPTMVVFDDGNTILKELTFDQPTTWLATQLKRDPDLWNRQWAIEQLAHRPADAAAVAALAEAATRADYFRTRAGAVEALAGLPAASAAAALEAALRDTPAQVRRAGMTALGQLGGARTAQLPRPTFHTDPSYEVRAAALTALVRP